MLIIREDEVGGRFPRHHKTSLQSSFVRENLWSESCECCNKHPCRAKLHQHSSDMSHCCRTVSTSEERSAEKLWPKYDHIHNMSGKCWGMAAHQQTCDLWRSFWGTLHQNLWMMGWWVENTVLADGEMSTNSDNQGKFLNPAPYRIVPPCEGHCYHHIGVCFEAWMFLVKKKKIRSSRFSTVKTDN